MLIDQAAISRVLDWAYTKALDGGPGLDSAEELAKSYAIRPCTEVEQCNSLIRWQVAKASASGFVSGLGGVLTLPVAVPANMASVLFVQLRMIAAVAHIGGYQPRNDQVRTLAYLCLCGNGAAELAKGVGVQLGIKLAHEAVARISGQTLMRINQQVGFRLLTKFGQAGVFNLGNAIPFVGGFVSGAFDGTTTNLVGNTARRMFVEGGPSLEIAAQ